MKKQNKKNLIIASLAILLVCTAIFGTVAWLTKTSSLTNTFTVGSFEVPTTDPTDSSKEITLEGNIYEPSWKATEEHKLTPAASFTKNPYVGIGKGSEDAVVYVYVENSLSNKVYFSINSGWEAVEADNGFKSGTYTSGLFKYTAGLTASKTEDVWTTNPLFSAVEVDETASATDFSAEKTEIKVSSFLHQAKNGNGDSIESSDILAAAKEVFNIE